VAAIDHLPGQYTFTRAQVQGTILEQNRQALQGHAGDLQGISGDLVKARESYVTTTITPAVRASTNSLSNWQSQVTQQFGPNLKKIAHLKFPAPEKPPFAPSISTDQISRELRSIDGRKTFSEKWEGLDRIYRVKSFRLQDVPSGDRSSVIAAYDRYFDGNGVYKGNSASQSLCTGASLSLKSSPDSDVGLRVRDQVNKALVGYKTSQTNDAKAESAGALSFALAGDAAVSAGLKEQGTQYLNASAATLDLALGFIPIAASINDAYQIIHGIATGVDYAGRPMSAADYGLRAVGVVIGLLPAGAVLRVGEHVLDTSFLFGARLLRSSGAGAKFASAFRACAS
jgi:hypothetical protein